MALTHKDIFNLATHPGTWKTTGVETQYSIVLNTDAVWLVLRYSSEKEDWIANFDFAVIPYKRQPERWLAHRGFVHRWKAARDQIFEEVAAILKETKLPLYITGYSHGGALAVLAHEDFGFHGYNPETITFGSPRVLWLPSISIRKRFAKLTRIANRGDIVTHLPFAWMLYRHVGNSLHIGTCNIQWIHSHLPSQYRENL